VDIRAGEMSMEPATRTEWLGFACTHFAGCTR